MDFIPPGGTEPKGPWHATYIRFPTSALVSYPFPVNKHRGPPARAAGHRKNWKAGPLRLVLLIPRGRSSAQSLRGRLAVEDVDFEDQK
jgi:hypothetical protein